MNRRYLEPIPDGVKNIGATGYILFQQKAKFKLGEGLYFEAGKDSTQVVFKIEFP